MHPELNNHELWLKILHEFYSDMGGDDDVYLCLRSYTFKELWDKPALRAVIYDEACKLTDPLRAHKAKAPGEPLYNNYYPTRLTSNQLRQLRLDLINHFIRLTTPCSDITSPVSTDPSPTTPEEPYISPQP